MSGLARLLTKIAFGMTLVSLIILGAYLLSREEYDRFDRPDGRYTAIVSYRRYERFMMRPPGDGDGKPGFVEIIDRSGKSLGRIPIPLVHIGRQIEWTPSGAEIPLVGVWDFKRGTCYYWSEHQDEQIWVRR